MKPLERAVKILGSQTNLAKALGVSKPFITQMLSSEANIVRAVPVKHCLTIERVTDGQVTRKDLRPNDWHEIWTDIK